MHEPHHPEGHCTPNQPTLSLTERPAVSMINLRGSPGDRNFVERVEQVIGMALPVSPNQYVTRGEAQCIWQGPDEWLLVLPEGDQHALIDSLEEALDGQHHAVTDVTGNRVVFHLGSESATALLASGCSLDFAETSFPGGVAAQTILARTPVTILRAGDGSGFDIHARRSYRAWLRDWLIHSQKIGDAR